MYVGTHGVVLVVNLTSSQQIKAQIKGVLGTMKPV